MTLLIFLLFQDDTDVEIIGSNLVAPGPEAPTGNKRRQTRSPAITADNVAFIPTPPVQRRVNVSPVMRKPAFCI